MHAGRRRSACKFMPSAELCRAHVRCTGKGRKERCTPLAAYARTAIQTWLNEPARRGATALFPNRHGGRLSADSVQSLLAKYVCAACERCPSLKSKRVSPHVLRHSAAMELLQAGVDCAVIALWLTPFGIVWRFTALPKMRVSGRWAGNG